MQEISRQTIQGAVVVDGVTYASKTRIILRDGDIFAKVHAYRQRRPFGEIGWVFSASQCDADGKALLADEATDPGQSYRIDVRGVRQLVVCSDAEVDVAAAFEAKVQEAAARVVIAVRHAQPAGR